MRLIYLLIPLILFTIAANSDITQNTITGNVNFTSNQCTKEQVIWFRENYGNINTKIYWDRYLNIWQLAFYDDNGDLYNIPKFKNDYGLPSYAGDDRYNKTLSEAKKKEYAEYYACVWMRRVYEMHSNMNMSRPDTLQINMDLSNIK